MKILKAISIVSCLFIGCGGGGGGDGYNLQDVTPYIKGWGTAELIETDNSGTAVNPRINIDTSENVIAVWQQYDGEKNNIWANRYTAGSGWGTPEMIETDNSGSANKPQIAIDTRGNAIAVWQQNSNKEFSIWANRYVPGSGWSNAELIKTDNSSTAINPRVAVDTIGNAIAVWKHHNGTEISIWANRYVPGSGWGTAKPIETGTGIVGDPQIVIDTSGNAIAVWHQYDGATYNIWANRYVAGSDWSTAELIESVSNRAVSPQISINKNGSAIAVWQQDDSTINTLWANRYVPGFGWSTAEHIETGNLGTVSEPQVVMDTNGNAIAVWQQHDGERNNIWTNRFD